MNREDLELYKITFRANGANPERSEYFGANSIHKAIELFDAEYPEDVLQSLEWIGYVCIETTAPAPVAQAGGEKAE